MTKAANKQLLNGFTLAESSVVLLLVSLLCILQYSPSVNATKKMNEQNFWQQFRQNWTSLVITCRRADTAGRVLFYGDSLKFFYSKGHPMQKLLLPATLHLKGGKREEELYANGGTQSQTIAFYSDLDGCTYNIYFELGFGGQYRVEQTKGP